MVDVSNSSSFYSISNSTPSVTPTVITSGNTTTPSSFFVTNPAPENAPGLLAEITALTNTSQQQLAAYTVVTDTWASNVTINWNSANLHRITLTGSTCNLTFTGGTDGEKLTLEITQDATGGRTVVFPSNIRYSPLISSITLSTSANQMDKLGFMYNASANVYDLVAVIYGYH